MIQNDRYQLIQNEKQNIYDKIMKILDNNNDTIVECNIIECHYMDNNKFSGIISYFLEKSDGYSENLKLSVGNSYYEQQYDVSNLLLFNDFDIDKGFMGYVYERKNAWIEYDFGKRKINMTSYTIKALGRFQNQLQPRTWKFVGSNNHEKWEMIDFKENNDDFNKGNFIGHFKCINKGKFYRYIKYIQISNWNGFERSKIYNNYKYFNLIISYRILWVNFIVMKCVNK